MTRYIQALALTTIVLLPVTAVGQSSQATAETQYANALAKETAVRAAFKGDLAPDALQKAVRTVVADYEKFVQANPTSVSSDDALWKAANLSLEVFKKLGGSQDREAAARLFSRLTSEYPASTLARQAQRASASIGSAEGSPSPSLPSASRTTAAVVKRPPTTPRIALVSAVRRTVVPDAVRVIIELDREVSYREERLADPDRVFVDLSSTGVVPALANQTLRFESDEHPVRLIRVGRHPNNTTRVVLETAGISTCSVYPLYVPYQLVIDCIPAGQPGNRPWSAVTRPPAPVPVPALLARPVGESAVQSRLMLPSAAPASASSLKEARLPEAPPILISTAAAPGAISLAPMRPPAKNLAGGFSMARQLGLGVSRIVIDPGHGGQDPGAKARGTTEAEVVLDIALRLEKLLEAEPGVEIILTRRSDAHVTLEERTAIANREAADLFLSIHVNASSIAEAAGVETYFLNFATNMSAASVAARENAASGQSMGALPNLVKSIALNSKIDESRDLATLLQRELVAGLHGGNKNLKDLGVKQAPFVVLIGAAMPSALAEIAFMTNTQEARLLQSGSYRQRVAQALFSGIRKYQGSLTNVDQVASQ